MFIIRSHDHTKTIAPRMPNFVEMIFSIVKSVQTCKLGDNILRSVAFFSCVVRFDPLSAGITYPNSGTRIAFIIRGPLVVLFGREI